MQHSSAWKVTSNQTASKSTSQTGRAMMTPDNPFCSYSHRSCMQNKLQGYEYCIKHILEDPNAPFKQCNYISNKMGKRCTNAAVRTERKDGYCTEHARRTIVLRQRATRKRKPEETRQQLLEELEQHAPRTSNHGREVARRPRSADSLAARVLEYASSSESDGEMNAVDAAWLGDADSDAESVDSEQEDPLKHAGVYTAEEVALIARDKMIRLQSLYIDQFKRLQHLLKEKRRKYIHSVRGDREQYGSIHSSIEDIEQKDAYDKLQAMKRYHRRFGKEALLHRLNKERRMQVSEGANYKPPSYPKCIYSIGGNKCGERTVPLSKYCCLHILHDPHQVLFQSCSFRADACTRPVATLSGEESVCAYHTHLEDTEPRLPSRQTSQESDSKKESTYDDVRKSGEESVVDVTSVSEIPLMVEAHGTNKQPVKQPDKQPDTEAERQSEEKKGEIPLPVVDLADEQTMSGTEDTSAKICTS